MKESIAVVILATMFLLPMYECWRCLTFALSCKAQEIEEKRQGKTPGLWRINER